MINGKLYMMVGVTIRMVFIQHLSFHIKYIHANFIHHVAVDDFPFQIQNFFEKSSLTGPLGLQILPLFEESKIDFDVVNDMTLSDTTPRSQSEPQIFL